MPMTTVQHNRLAIGALVVGVIAGLVAFGSLAVFEAYVAGVMGGLSGLTPLAP